MAAIGKARAEIVHLNASPSLQAPGVLAVATPSAATWDGRTWRLPCCGPANTSMPPQRGESALRFPLNALYLPLWVRACFIDQKVLDLLAFLNSGSDSQRGFAPRPAHVSPPGSRYYGATFTPLRLLRPLLSKDVSDPPKLANCFSRVLQCETRACSTCLRRLSRAYARSP